MSVFDGGTYRVRALRKNGEEEDEYTDDPKALVEKLRSDPSVKAVETHTVHYVTGGYVSHLSFGSFDEDDEDD